MIQFYHGCVNDFWHSLVDSLATVPTNIKKPKHEQYLSFMGIVPRRKLAHFEKWGGNFSNFITFWKLAHLFYELKVFH